MQMQTERDFECAAGHKPGEQAARGDRRGERLSLGRHLLCIPLREEWRALDLIDLSIVEHVIDGDELIYRSEIRNNDAT